MKRLVLAGAGHAHARVLWEFARRPLAQVEIVLVSPVRQAPYSGMVPGWLAGLYAWQECCVDFSSLCERAGVTLRHASVTDVNTQRRELTLDDGERLAYDWLSLDIGATLSPPETKRMCVLAMRPLAALNKQWEALHHQILHLQEGDRCHVVVVGGGAAGVESMLAIHAALTRRAPTVRFEFTLATHGQEILAGMARGAAERLQRHLCLRQISLLYGFSADRIEGDTVVSTSGQRLQADVAVWATGAQAYPWLGRAGLPVNAQGFVKIDAMLRSVRSSRVFATGDCAAWEPALPKAGVYAVRMGPVLAHNLRAIIEGRALRAYEPRRRHLVLVGTGGAHAVAAWGPFSWEGAWVWRWKEAIDRRFIRRTQRM